MLEISNIYVSYGPVPVLFDVSIKVEGSCVVSIIGANGAGKSTLMKTIVGICRPTSGHIMFEGKALHTMPSHQIIKSGVIYVPEGRQILGKMTVTENLEMGAYSQKYTKREINAKFEEMFELFPRLKERAKQLGGTLSGGEQQMLAIARGLMASPKMLMLDEPSMGLAPVIVDDVFSLLERINRVSGIPILVVEQNAYIALNISNTCYVLENGRVVISGDSKELLKSDEIRKSYLGG